MQPLDEDNSQHFEEAVPQNVDSLEEELYDKQRWDEGGRSDCGFADTIHDTLMSLGGWMHGILGDPDEEMSSRMKGIGNYFQEASYAVRDFKRGTLDKGEFRFNTDDLEVEEEIEEPSDDEES